MEKRDASGLTEAEYIEKYKEKDYPKPGLTADILIFADGRTKLLLIKRKGHPYIGQWAFPGGFAESTETIEETAARELEEETGIKGLELKRIKLFSRLGRDPRGWTVSMAYAADVALKDCRPVAGDDAAEAEWFDFENSGNTVRLSHGDIRIAYDYSISGEDVSVKFTTEDILAFDHAEILAYCIG